MGESKLDKTHVKRSSSMSFAQRWNDGNVRLITMITASVLITTALFVILMQQSTTKQIEFVINGERTVVMTKHSNLDKLLEEYEIQLEEHDHMMAPQASKLKHGDTIRIEHAFPVHVSVDGVIHTIHTIGGNVADMLAKRGIQLGEWDKIRPALDTEVSAHYFISITRISKHLAELNEPIPYEVLTQADSKLLKGKAQIVQEGQEGTRVKWIENIFEDGTLISQKVVEEVVATEQVDEIVAIGTKNPVTILSASSEDVDKVTKGDLTFGVKQVLSNVTLTAYSAHFESTLKNPGDAGYGITYTGTTVKEGHTVAVDPKVIPLGWWLYIDGVGLRRAEDIGSAIKGKKVDVYFEDGEYVKRFGLKKGHTVYVIGPKKPSTN